MPEPAEKGLCPPKLLLVLEPVLLDELALELDPLALPGMGG